MSAATPENSQIIPVSFGPRLRKSWALKDGEIVWSGPAGTGKTRMILERQHRIQTKYQKARGLIVRKYRASMTHSCIKTFEDEVLGPDLGPGKLVKWSERDQTYTYATNGSEIVVSGMDDPTKILSSKYDWFYFNEVIEGKLSDWETIMTRLRSYKVPYQQALGDTNPGPQTHWIKKRAEAKLLKLIETTHHDNPYYWDEKKEDWTKEGKDYVLGRLGRLTGVRRARLLEGRWVSAEGVVYPDWDPNVHVIPRDKFRPKKNWLRIWSVDFGFNPDPFVWQNWLLDPETRDLYLDQELYHTNMIVSDCCKVILEASKGQPWPQAVVCDHDAEDRATFSRETGLPTLPAFKLIQPGLQGVTDRLRNAVQKSRTKDLAAKSGPTVMEAIAGLAGKQALRNKPGVYLVEGYQLREDPTLAERYWPLRTDQEFDCYVWPTIKENLDHYKDVPVDKDNHGMDAMRYCIAFVDNLAVDPDDEEFVVPLADEVYQQISAY